MKILVKIYVQILSQKTCDEALANVKVLPKVAFFSPEFFTKADSDDETILEDSRISSRILKSKHVRPKLKIFPVVKSIEDSSKLQ